MCLRERAGTISRFSDLCEVDGAVVVYLLFADDGGASVLSSMLLTSSDCDTEIIRKGLLTLLMTG